MLKEGRGKSFEHGYLEVEGHVYLGGDLSPHQGSNTMIVLVYTLFRQRRKRWVSIIL